MSKENIAKIVISVYACQSFLLALNTTALAGSQDVRNTPSGPVPKGLEAKQPLSERVVVSNRGSDIVFTVSGSQGRHYAVAYRNSRNANEFELLPLSRGIIGKDGVAIIIIDSRNFLDREILFKLITSKEPSFSKNSLLRGTDWFAVYISSKANLNIPPFSTAAHWDDGANAVAGVRGIPNPKTKIIQLQGSPRSSNTPLLNINTASLSTLRDTLGIDEMTARTIISRRPFKTINDLQGIHEMTEAKFRQVATTLTVRVEGSFPEG